MTDGGHMRKLQLLFLLLYILSFATFSIGSSESPTVLVNGGHFDCLPVSTFGLQGIRLWKPENTVSKTLGDPNTITIGGGEDDGGRYDIKTYHYDHLQIDIVRGKVDRIYTMSNKVAMPSGIRVGYTMDQVIQILGRKPRDWQGTQSEFSVVTCPVNGDWVQEDYVNLKFNNNKVLTSIEYSANRP
jgi:hypothetical protein